MEKSRYPSKSFRLSPQTLEALEKVKKTEGKSWNRTFIELVQIYFRVLKAEKNSEK